MSKPAKKSAPAQKTKRRKTKKRSNANFTLSLILFVIAALLLMRHSAIFFIAGMLPTIVAAIIDQGPGRFHLRIVGCMNLAGILPYLIEFYHQGNSASAVRQVMADPSSWAVIWVYAGTGWLLWFLGPRLLAIIINFFSDNKVASLEDEQEKLIAEWGESVRNAPRNFSVGDPDMAEP